MNVKLSPKIVLTILSVAVQSVSASVTIAKPNAGAISGLQKFDLICAMKGKVVSDPHPRYVGTYPADTKNWQYSERILVDIRNMKYCEFSDCSRVGRESIIFINSKKIVFSNSPPLRSVFHYGDMQLVEKLFDGETVSVTSGSCQIDRFSGFPASN